MASDDANDQPFSSTQPTLVEIDVPYLVVTFGLPEAEIKTLLKTPTVELTQKFMASVCAKGQSCDKLVKEHSGTCHFMKLPPELRLEIYKLVCQDVLKNIPCDVGSITARLQGTTSRVCEAVRSRHLKAVLSVLHTSRGLRVEAFEAYNQLAGGFRDSTEASLKLIPGWPGGIYWLQYCRYPHLGKLQSRYKHMVNICKALQLVETSMSNIRSKTSTEN